MAISHNFPSTRPSLNLNFARSKRLDPRVTFTRTSTATYIDEDGLLKTANVNQPRFDHNPTTGESLGLLIEESRTNLLQRSEEFDNATWSKNNVGVTTNFAVAPDGTTTAEEIFPTTVGSQLRYLIQSYTISTAQSYTFSIFVKKHTLTSNFLAIRISNHTATADIYSNFNFSTETFAVASTTAGWTGDTSVQKLLNGWYRLSITANTVASTHTILQVNIWGGGYQGTTETIGNYLIWGAQLEVGAFPTSYIPTSGSQVTRSADNASIIGTNFSSWYNQSEGTFFAEAKSNATISGFTRRFFEVHDKTAGQRYLLGFSATSNTRFLVTSSSINVVDITTTANPSSGVKISAAYSTNNFCMSTNGLLPSVDTNGSVPSPVYSLTLGWDIGSSNANLCGTISQLTYYPLRLSNSQLQELTK